MTNPEAWLDCVAHRIEQRDKYGTKVFLICWLKGGIACIPRQSGCKPEIVFGVYTNGELEQGFTTTQWDELSTKIINFLESTNRI